MSRKSIANFAILLLFFCQELRVFAQTKETALPGATANSSFKTSFDCAKAADYSVEQAVCRNDGLARLDLEMADAYEKRLKSATVSQRNALVSSQRKWLTIRDSYAVNPFYGDPTGTLSDVADFYRSRIQVLQSGPTALLETKLPPEYDWVRAIEPPGFSKGFHIGRGYMSCQDPCQKKPSLYRLLSIAGQGIGEGPGDVDTPYANVVHTLASEGWIKCRTATDTDTGQSSIEYFKKKDKMVAISRSYSMGTGNSIGLSIATSAPLPENSTEKPHLVAAIDSNWATYSSPDVGLEVRYPPGWWMRDDSRPNSGTKYLIFVANDSTGSFVIAMQPKEMWNPQDISKDPETGQDCLPSTYRISGFATRGCRYQGENVAEGTCTRYLTALDTKTDKYHLRFQPPVWGSFVDSNRYKLTDLYEKILSTITVK